MKRFLLLGLLALVCGLTHAQTEKLITYKFKEVTYSEVTSLGQPQIHASSAKYYSINVDEIEEAMDGVMHREDESSGFLALINFPYPDGTMHSYKAMENSTMSPELDVQFPEINAFDAKGMDEPTSVKWDITPQGLHVMIMRPGAPTIYIDPVIKGNNDYYIVYSRNDFTSDKLMDCQTQTLVNKFTTQIPTQNTPETFGSCELHAYRLAVSATGEYTQFHGGTVALAQAAQVTTMNRVNGVFEKDMAITMNIVGNNNLIVYTDGGTDPFTNGNPGNMINQNQTVCDNVIGSANYDIGHVFGTNSGGLAGLGVVCAGGNKARGVTGSGAPIGDPFDIDYVAHEMGHQFGANHTQNNNCNRNNATAMEPGSASTIMGYAGICAPNVQNNSDDHFHGISLQEIGVEIDGHTCEALSPLANSAPAISGSNGNVTVPANTPFALTAFATDADNDPLTYNWEQMDNEVSTQSPIPTSTGGPSFRSYSSSLDPTRYFPNLVDLSAGGPFTWEVLPSVTRTMDFRCTVRDNSPAAGGCNDHIDVTVTTDAGSGPFVVLYPSATGIVWTALTSETVTWDVANTDVAPVACANVDILLSTDGGVTYPTVLATNVPNDGSELVSVPNVGTTTARIMVICSSGTFFDISDNDFEIVALTDDFTMNTTPGMDTVCQPNDATFTVDIGVAGTFTDDVTLSISGVPAGATSSFSVNPVTPVGSSTLTISNTGAATPGDYTITVSGNSTTGTKTNTIQLTILPFAITTATLTAPANGAVDVALQPTMTWTAVNGATYDIQIATDAGFTNIVEQATGLTAENYTSTTLAPGTTYYWQVNATTQCGSSGFGTAFNFTTSTCVTYASTNVPQTIPSPGTATSTINIGVTGSISDLNVIDLIGTHDAVGNLTFTLTSPTGTVVTLMAGECGNQNDFDIDFDDEAGSAVIPCPPTDGTAYQPSGLLSAFDGEDPNGVWTLTIVDGNNPFGGQLTGWSLEICTTPTVCADPDVPTITYPLGSYCEGATATLSIAGNLNDATTWSIYSGSCGGTLLGTTAGTTFDVTLVAGMNDFFIRGEGGCVTPGTCGTASINVGAATAGTDVITACDSYTWIDGMTYTASNNTATHTLTNTAGCDSVVTLDLTINNATAGTDVVVACISYTWIDGMTYTASNNTATYTLTNAAGCDSVVTLDLTITTFTAGTDVITACDSYQWIDGVTYTSSNNTATHTIVGGSVNGCDSIVLLNLTINYSSVGTDVITTCDSYTWIDGMTYTASNTTATHILTNAAGCDSTVTLDLTINNSTAGVDVISACDSYTWINGVTYMASNNTATHTLTNAAGCDSTVTLDLTVNYSTGAVDVVVACISYTWIDGMTYTASNNTATQTLTNAAGCDSVVTLDLTISTFAAGTDVITACDSYQWIDGVTYTSSNNTATHTIVGGSVNGCDSIVTLDITVNYASAGTDIVTACDSYTWIDGTTYTVSNNTATHTLTNAAGCDSVVTLDLTIETIDIAVTQMDNMLTASASNVSYQWIDCDNGNAAIVGATAQSFSPTATGNYAVIVTSANCEDTSSCYFVDLSGIEESFASSLVMFPNPTEGNLTIQWEGEVSNVKLTDAKGRVIGEYAPLDNHLEVDMNAFSTGVYFVHIYSDYGIVVRDVIKM